MLPSGLCQRPPRCFPAARRNCFKSRIHQKTSLKRFGTFWIAVAQKTVLLELRASCLSLCHVCRGSPSAVPTCLTPNQVGLLKFGSGLSKSSFVLNRTNRLFVPSTAAGQMNRIRSALDYGDLSETFACAFGQSSWNGTRFRRYPPLP